MKGPAAPVPRLVMAKAMPKKKAHTEAMKSRLMRWLRSEPCAAPPKKKLVGALHSGPPKKLLAQLPRGLGSVFGALQGPQNLFLGLLGPCIGPKPGSLEAFWG